LNWQDILKETITQGRVKEIEDIDIDVEDDDCLRWLKKLYDIIARHPESELHKDHVQDEESACAIKEAWEKGKNPNPIVNNNNRGLPSNGYFNYTDDATVVFSVSVWSFTSIGQRGITLYSLDKRREKESAKIITIATSKEKAGKITKAICAYLNISYDKMAREVL